MDADLVYLGKVASSHCSYLEALSHQIGLMENLQV